ncbi:MAG: ATP-binding cassette domain-containing protein, partial [Ruminiclostridium sp.]
TILRNGQNIVDGIMSEFDRERFIYCMTGRKIAEDHFSSQSDSNDCVLKVSNIGRTGCFKDVSFDLHKGEILGITGLLGSGRTELAQALFGIMPIIQGEIHVNGKLVKIKSPKDAIENKIAYVPEDRLTQGLFLEQSISNNIIISTIDRFINKFKLIQRKKVVQEVENWLKKLNIKTSDPLNAVNVLSGGNQQRVVLAKWLSSKPNILILNAPTVGVDIGSKSDIHQIMRELSQQGLSIILISDDIPEVLDNCERVLVMKKGKIIDEVRSVFTNEAELFSKLSND